MYSYTLIVAAPILSFFFFLAALMATLHLLFNGNPRIVTFRYLMVSVVSYWCSWKLYKWDVVFFLRISGSVLLGLGFYNNCPDGNYYYYCPKHLISLKLKPLHNNNINNTSIRKTAASATTSIMTKSKISVVKIGMKTVQKFGLMKKGGGGGS